MIQLPPLLLPLLDTVIVSLMLQLMATAVGNASRSPKQVAQLDIESDCELSAATKLYLYLPQWVSPLAPLPIRLATPAIGAKNNFSKGSFLSRFPIDKEDTLHVSCLFQKYISNNVL